MKSAICAGMAATAVILAASSAFADDQSLKSPQQDRVRDHSVSEQNDRGGIDDKQNSDSGAALRLSAPRDARVAYGNIKISRPRFGEAVAATASALPASNGAIAVPSNTLGEGESRQQRATRETNERRVAEADARERDSAAEIARTEALLAEDRINDGVAYIGAPYGYPIYSNVYSGGVRYYTTPDRGPDRRHDRAGKPRGNRRAHSEPTITTEYFASDAAIHRFAEAATPRIGSSIEASQAAQRQFSAAAAPPIGRVQEQVDRAVIGNRLERVRSEPAKSDRAKSGRNRAD